MAVLAPVLFGLLLFAAYSVNSSESENILENYAIDNVGDFATDCKSSPLHVAVNAGDQKAVNELIKGGADIYSLDCQGRTPMHVALLQESDQMVLTLVENKFDVNRRFGKGRTALFYGAVYGREKPLRGLVDVGGLVDAVDSEGSTPLYEAVAAYRTDMVRVLFSLGADAKKKLPGGDTYLHRATREDNFHAAYFFVGLGTHLDAANDKGETPMKIAVLRDNPALVNLLLKRGADITKTDAQGQTYLHAAVSNNCSEAVQALLENGALVDPVSSIDETPLAIAVNNDLANVIKLLVDYKADVLRVSKSGQTYLHLAVKKGSVASLKELLARGVPVDSNDTQGVTPIMLAISGDDTTSAEALTDFGADLKQPYKTGTLLHLAAEHKSIKSVKFLLQHDLPADAKDSQGVTPIILAISGDDTTSAEALADFGADLKQPYKTGTLLHLAAEHKSIKSVKFLLQHDLPADAKDSQGVTPIILAISGDDTTSAEALTDFGADLKQPYKTGTLLHLAVEHKSRKSVKFLLQHDLPADSKDSQGVTPIILAISGDDTTSAEALADFGADLKQPYKTGTLLHLAVEHKSIKSVKFLLQHDLPADSKDSQGVTPIILAISGDDTTSAEALADFGADLKQPYKTGTLLHLAVEHKSIKSIKFLVQHGLPADSDDSEGVTPIRRAVDNDDPNSIKALVLAGANIEQKWRPDLISLLHWSAIDDRTNAIRALVENGLSVNVTNRDNVIPLHWAASNGHLESTRILVELHSCINCREDGGQTPLYWAHNFNHVEVANYLRSVGGVE